MPSAGREIGMLKSMSMSKEDLSMTNKLIEAGGVLKRTKKSNGVGMQVNRLSNGG